MQLKFFCTLLIFVFAKISYSSGDWGSYRIQGNITCNGSALKNEQVVVRIGLTDTTIQTDSLGMYAIVISWSTFHKVGESFKTAVKKNPKHIYFTYKNSTRKVKNEWQNSRNYFLGLKTRGKIYPIEYREGQSPQMFGETDSYTTPNIYVIKDLKFGKE